MSLKFLNKKFLVTWLSVNEQKNTTSLENGIDVKEMPTYKPILQQSCTCKESMASRKAKLYWLHPVITELSFILVFSLGKTWFCWTLTVYICKGWKMRCTLILPRIEVRGQITKCYFYRTLSIYDALAT